MPQQDKHAPSVISLHKSCSAAGLFLSPPFPPYLDLNDGIGLRFIVQPLTAEFTSNVLRFNVIKHLSKRKETLANVFWPHLHNFPLYLSFHRMFEKILVPVILGCTGSHFDFLQSSDFVFEQMYEQNALAHSLAR